MGQPPVESASTDDLTGVAAQISDLKAYFAENKEIQAQHRTRFDEQLEAWRQMRRDASEVRGRFMLLAAGIVGGVVPVLRASTPSVVTSVEGLRIAACCFIATLVVGAIKHAFVRKQVVNDVLFASEMKAAEMHLAVVRHAHFNLGSVGAKSVGAPAIEDAADRVRALSADLRERFRERSRWHFVEETCFFGSFIAGAIGLATAFLF